MTEPTSTHAGWGSIARRDPALLAAYQALVAAPDQQSTLEAKVRAFVRIAAYSAVGAIDSERLESEIRAALAAGGTEQEIVDVLEIVSILGIHSSTVAGPILLEEMRDLGLELPDAEAPAVQAIREEFTLRRGYWNPLWEAIGSFGPEFLKAYLDYSSIPVERATLDAQTREIIFLVGNCVTTHLNAAGARIHIRNALNLGVTGAQLMEVFQLLAPLGIASCVAGFAALDSATAAN
jgi:alkylhydroperoxidase/carboxymuconolactone decarboxylase family protein YurZ